MHRHAIPNHPHHPRQSCPMIWVGAEQSGKETVQLSGRTFSSSARMADAPLDITAADGWGSHRQWSTEALGASSGLPDPIINNPGLGFVWDPSADARAASKATFRPLRSDIFKERFIPQSYNQNLFILWNKFLQMNCSPMTEIKAEK